MIRKIGFSLGLFGAPIWSNKLSTAPGAPHSKAESLLFGLATLSKDKGGIVVRDFEGIYLMAILQRCQVYVLGAGDSWVKTAPWKLKVTICNDHIHRGSVSMTIHVGSW